MLRIDRHRFFIFRFMKEGKESLCIKGVVIRSPWWSSCCARRSQSSSSSQCHSHGNRRTWCSPWVVWCCAYPRGAQPGSFVRCLRSEIHARQDSALVCSTSVWLRSTCQSEVSFFASLSVVFASCDGTATGRHHLICRNWVRLMCARTKGSSQTPPCDQYIFLQGMSLMPMKNRIAKKTSKSSSVTSFHPSKIARVNSFGQQQVAVAVCVHLHQSTNRLPKQIEDCQRITKSRSAGSLGPLSEVNRHSGICTSSHVQAEVLARRRWAASSLFPSCRRLRPRDVDPGVASLSSSSSSVLSPSPSSSRSLYTASPPPSSDSSLPHSSISLPFPSISRSYYS